MATKATNPVLVSVGSHNVSTRNSRDGNPSKEELYPVLTVTWRGAEHRVTFEANRYTSSDGDWSDWRIFAQSYGNDLSDIARRAVTEAGEPVIREWLASNDYSASRRDAFKYLCKNAIREENYNMNALTALVDKYEHELHPDAWHELRCAVSAKDSYLRAMDRIK